VNRKEAEFVVGLGLFLIRQRRREEARKRMEEWAAQSAAHLRRWAEQHERNLESILRVDQNLAKLVRMLGEATSTARRERIEGWIGVDRERVRALELRNEALKKKIRDLEHRLREAGAANYNTSLGNLGLRRMGVGHRAVARPTRMAGMAGTARPQRR
jgi:hypothetical protein